MPKPSPSKEEPEEIPQEIPQIPKESPDVSFTPKIETESIDDSPFIYDYVNRTIRKRPSIQTYTFLAGTPVGKLRAGGSTTCANNQDVKIALNTSVFTAVGITADTANSKFTTTQAGKYMVVGCIQFQASVDGARYNAKIFVGGVETTNVIHHAGSTNGISATVTDILNIATNTDIELYTNHNAGGDQTASAGEGATYLLVLGIT